MNNIAIIGTGNLGLSIVEGLIQKIEGSKIYATRRNTSTIEHLKKHGVVVTSDNVLAIQNAEIIVLALKPYKIEQVVNEFKKHLTEKHILISLATGVSLDQIKQLTGKCKQVFRAMPNVAAVVGESATCVSRNGATETAVNKVVDFFNLIGTTTVINEELMESATVLGACGTAFALRFIRAMVQAGIQIGFSSHTATQIANQTVKGAAEILLKNGNHPEAEIDKVTTPKGITITGLNEMEHQGFSAALIRGMLTAYKKIEDNS